MSASTTDSYGIDATRGTRSRFTAIIEDAGAPDFVASYAMFLLNTWAGARPSDCAARAVREWQQGTISAYGDWHRS